MNLIVFVYLTVCYFPGIFGQERNPECRFPAGLANALFAWVIISLEIIITLILMAGYLLKWPSLGALGRLTFVENGILYT
jgi:hypothetical protein